MAYPQPQRLTRFRVEVGHSQVIVLARDATTELRVLVTAPAEQNTEKSVPVRFRITDIGLGETAVATDNFVTPQ